MKGYGITPYGQSRESAAARETNSGIQNVVEGTNCRLNGGKQATKANMKLRAVRKKGCWKTLDKIGVSSSHVKSEHTIFCIRHDVRKRIARLTIFNINYSYSLAYIKTYVNILTTSMHQKEYTQHVSTQQDESFILDCM